jgi:hypothetical protein
MFNGTIIIIIITLLILLLLLLYKMNCFVFFVIDCCFLFFTRVNVVIGPWAVTFVRKEIKIELNWNEKYTSNTPEDHRTINNGLPNTREDYLNLLSLLRI